jgi:cytochrome c556
MRVTLMAAVASLAMAGVAYAAADPAIEKAVSSRQANFKTMGKSFKALSEALAASPADLNAVKQNAQTLANTAAVQPGLFPKGSGPESGLKMEAKAEIWSDNATFVRLQKDNISAAQALASAAQGGDVAAIQKARGALGGTCKACHEKFRSS